MKKWWNGSSYLFAGITIFGACALVAPFDNGFQGSDLSTFLLGVICIISGLGCLFDQCRKANNDDKN